MTGIRTFEAEQLEDWGRLLAGCGGLEGSAEAVAATMSQLRPIIIAGKRLEREVADKLTSWAPFQEIEEKLSGHSSHAAIGAYGNRLAGMRLPWTASDPEVSRFRKEILRVAPSIARPDQARIGALGQLGEIEQFGNLVTCDTLPIAVGEVQIRQFVAVRWPYVGEELVVCASHRKDLSRSYSQTVA